MRYELDFVVEPIDDDTHSALSRVHDVLTGEHSGVHLLTIVAEGDTGFAAARSIVETVEREFGVTVLRYHEDLVTRRDIAERTGMSTQAVRQWIYGPYKTFPPFPVPDNLVFGGVWRWAAVVDWLKRIGREVDEEVSQPTREDVVLIEHWLATRDRVEAVAPVAT